MYGSGGAREVQVLICTRVVHIGVALEVRTPAILIPRRACPLPERRSVSIRTRALREWKGYTNCGTPTPGFGGKLCHVSKGVPAKDVPSA